MNITDAFNKDKILEKLEPADGNLFLDLSSFPYKEYGVESQGELRVHF